MRPGSWTRRMIENAVTDLPLPDSPTRPSVSPLRISNDTSLTATTGPNTVRRFSTLSNGSNGLLTVDSRLPTQSRLTSRYSPKTVRSVSAISPTVACASTAAMIGGTRLSLEVAAPRTASSDARHVPASREARSFCTLCTCCTSSSGSTWNTSMVDGSSVAYLFTPTTTASPESMASCALYADSCTWRWM